MKKRFRNLCSFALTFLLPASLFSCQKSNEEVVDPTLATEEPVAATYSNEFNEQVKEWTKKTNAKFNVSYYTTSAVYCSNPTHPAIQSISLYCPTNYLNEDGTLNKAGTVGKYTADTAPIIYWNSSGSYIGMGPFAINSNSTRSTQYGWVLNMINEGFVVCMVGERGKTNTDENNKVIGRGPIAISDLKAGVRFLKHNDAVIPGSSNKIVSVGTSSGGSMSALLGTSGNNTYYATYLREMGACMDVSDDVWATQAYCPITDLSHADFAYEWMFNESNDSYVSDETGLSDFQKALSQKFTKEYAKYINSLELKDENNKSLTLSEDGTKSGTYYDWLVSKYEIAFENYAKNYDTDYKGYATGANGGAKEADDYDWLNYNVSTGEATLSAPDGMDSALDALVLSGYCTRQKECPSFDSLSPMGTDNDLFGKQETGFNEEWSARHYNQRIAEIIKELQEDYPTEYALYYDSYYEDSHTEEVITWNRYLNSYSFLTGEAESTVSPNFRINMGAKDADTSITISSTLALLLEKKGINTEFNILWGWGHNDVDTPTGLCDWVKSLN